MKTTKIIRTLALLALLLPSVGCIDEKSLMRIDPLDSAKILQSAPISTAIQQTRTLGATMCSAMVVLLCFVCWYRSQTGAQWVRLMWDFFAGIVLAVYLVGSIGQPWGLGEYTLHLGRDLGQHFRWVEASSYDGSGSIVVTADPREAKVKQNSRNILITMMEAYRDSKFAAGSVEDAFINWILKPEVSFFVNLNTIASYLVRVVIGISYAWLIAFYQIALPLLAWTAILPQTRHVMIGWFKGYLAICLWPVFFGMVERCNNATLRLIEAQTSSFAGPGTMERFVFSQLELLVMTFVIVGMYFMVPVISRRLVNGAAESFKVGFVG